MRIRLAIPDRLVTPEALEAALEATSLANEQAIIRGEVPPLSEAIRKGVRWKPEPYLDGEHFDLSHEVAARGWGDCDDLAPWLTGELRASGEDPGARSRVYKTGKDRWHVVTETSDGTILDPSKWAGMGRKSAAVSGGIAGMTARPFARMGEGALCCVPHRGKYWSRVDLPFPDAAGHIASHACARTADESLYRAVAGAIACGEEIDSELCDRARVMGAMLLGDLAGIDGDDGEVGSFFGKLLKKALPFAAGFIPGIGPIASQAAKTAISAAEKIAKKKKSGVPTTPAEDKHLKKITAAAVAPPQSLSTLTALAHGGGSAAPTSDTIMHAPTGAVSVPIADRSQGQPAMLFYHPANSIGPVVMRF